MIVCHSIIIIKYLPNQVFFSSFLKEEQLQRHIISSNCFLMPNIVRNNLWSNCSNACSQSFGSICQGVFRSSKDNLMKLKLGNCIKKKAWHKLLWRQHGCCYQMGWSEYLRKCQTPRIFTSQCLWFIDNFPKTKLE